MLQRITFRSHQVLDSLEICVHLIGIDPNISRVIYKFKLYYMVYFKREDLKLNISQTPFDRNWGIDRAQSFGGARPMPSGKVLCRPFSRRPLSSV